MEQTPVTLRDVAREAGVHTSTVSRALNSQTRSVVNPGTAARVLAAAERLGYSPHPLARGLRTNTTMSVGMVIPDVENPLFGPIIAGVESALGKSDYSLLIVNTQPDSEETASLIDTLLMRRIDGLIIATASADDVVTRNLADRGVRAIQLNRHDYAGRLPAVVTDDRNGIQLAIEHLVELGHTNIGHVAGPLRLSTGANRASAFVDIMQSMGLATRDDVIEEARWFGIEPGTLATASLLDRHPGLTAIVAGNDLLALGAYKAAALAGRKPGEDLSIIGFNDMPLADLVQPSMTSVAIPYRHMGELAAQILLDWMHDEKPSLNPVMMSPTLAIRDSTTAVSR